MLAVVVVVTGKLLTVTEAVVVVAVVAVDVDLVLVIDGLIVLMVEIDVINVEEELV